MEIPLSQIYLDNYFHLVGVVILYYDHALTFRDEYAHIWRNPRAGASLLFLLNRYFAFFSNIVMTVGKFVRFRSVERFVFFSIHRRAQPISAVLGAPLEGSLFDGVLGTPSGVAQAPRAIWQQSSDDTLVQLALIVGIIQALRTYALYRRDQRIALLMIAVALSLAGVAIWAAIGPTPDVSLAIGCTIASPRHTAIRYATAWEALFVWDSVVFTLTLLKTYKERFRYAAVARGNDLLSLIVRDGAVYFAIMACAQCANSLTYYFCPPALIGTLCTFASSISVSMMSRLMLNLHRSARAPRLQSPPPHGPDLMTTLGVMTSGFGFAGASAPSSDATSAGAEAGADVLVGLDVLGTPKDGALEAGLVLCETRSGKGKARAADCG
ncbi:hypothetical protein PsYK624_026970 [Phanerochaete sordida]|uniref:DUF6533 domain-containing protein n=1 Tax=Phanerochaete sordida TaxID=48140 RepID=A0A9P3G0B9_9APHY|nr:hypothetical protein PsYK624_026970 [Phanerochaete sordida]